MALSPDKPRAGVLDKTVVLVGLMGAGKSTVGRRLAMRICVPFIDADAEIEMAANLSIAEIFERFDEQYFREGESRVIARLLAGPPCILATGGGAFMSTKNREVIANNGVSVWIRADLDTLWDRVKDKPGRPLLQRPDARDFLSQLLIAREPVYSQADITIDSHAGVMHETVVDSIVAELAANGHLKDDGIDEAAK